MNPFWKTILTTLLGAASLVGARYSANWIANHTYRANRTQQVTQMMPPVHWSAPRHVTVPNYFRHSSTSYSYRHNRWRR
jgi:hypothetical protein